VSLEEDAAGCPRAVSEDREQTRELEEQVSVLQKLPTRIAGSSLGKLKAE